MLLVDVIFPLNIPTLSYLCPEELRDKAEIGKFVTAPLKNKAQKGIIYRIKEFYADKKDISQHEYTLHRIIDIEGTEPVLTADHLRLIEWISEYYYAELGLVLKGVIPKELLKDQKRKSVINPRLRTQELETRFRPIEVDKAHISSIQSAMNIRKFASFLLHCPSFDYELSFLISLIKEVNNAIVLCPEIMDSEYIAYLLKKHSDKEVIPLHSDLKGRKKSDAYNSIIKNVNSIVVGTMSAVLSPVKNASLIVVLQEHSYIYKQDKAPRYNARDVAVMRGSIENATVLLMSVCPSSISYFNATKGKYRLMEPKVRKERPVVQIINMRKKKDVISEKIIDLIKTTANNSNKSLILIHRKGYSMLKCKDCGYIFECNKCNVPLIIHDNKRLYCHRCKSIYKSVDRCINCSGTFLEYAGVGTQRVEEIINNKLVIHPIRIDSDIIKTKRAFREVMDMAHESLIIIGTKMISKNIFFNKYFHVIAIINPDIYLNSPDYLSTERLFQDLCYSSEMIRDKGKMYIQTHSPENSIYRFLKSYDYYGFIKAEIKRRKELFYPPFSKLASITFYFKSRSLDIPVDIPQRTSDYEIMGPVHSGIKKKGFKDNAQIIIKAKDSKRLKKGIEMVLNKAREKKIRLDIDIDPVSFG